MKNLTTLHLPKNVTDAGLKELAALENLGYLDLTHSKEITDAGLKELAGFKNVTRLGVGGAVTNAGMKELARFKKLTQGQGVYDVRLDTEGHAECSCPGCVFHRQGKPCKHLRALCAAGMLPRTVLQPVTSNEPF